MTAHISEELPRLLTGEASRAEVLEAAAHLRTCADCQQELVSAVVAHASLASAQRFAPEIMSADVAPADEDAVGELPTPLPDLSSVFTRVREDAASAKHRTKRRTVIAGVAAAAVVAGGTAAAVTLTSGSSAPPKRTVALKPVGSGRAGATATLIGTDHMRIDATALPALDARHHYEVWLTRGKTMQAVGFIGPGNTADITVPTSVMLSYHDIAVSVQGVHQTQFSGRVVVAGDYA